MNGYWGEWRYGDQKDATSERVPLRSEKCSSRPPSGTPGTHTCRSHRDHATQGAQAFHRCICGKKWDHAGKVLT